MSSVEQRQAAKKYYYKVRDDPAKLAHRLATREVWYEANKKKVLEKQRDRKRKRKLEAIEYLGGVCQRCAGEFPPAVFEFHHRNPAEKDRDPSKLMQMKWERITEELDKCDLLCANCHRMVHHDESK